MKNSWKSERFYIFLLFILLFLFGCQGGGGFQDIAFVKQAQRELRRIRNALEEYKMDNGTYPGEHSDLRFELAPYLSKFIYSEGKAISQYSGIVLGARNNLDQIRTALSACARIQETQIGEIFTHIRDILETYEKILRGKSIEFTSILPEISKMQSAINNLNPATWKKSINDSLIQEGRQIISVTTSLLSDTSIGGSEHLEHIRRTYEWYNSNLIGEKVSKKGEIYSPESEISALIETVDTSNFNVGTLYGVSQLISNYRELEGRSNYCDFLDATMKDLERVKKLVLMLEGKMESAPEAAKIMTAQANLHRMADALKDYRREFKKFPSQDANIDSILHSYFIEVTMSGDTMDRWEETLSWFPEHPVYETRSPEFNFTLKAKAKDSKYTPLLSKVVVQNKWDEVISAFSIPPIYTTLDSTRTYFIKTKARDSGGTWVTDRPPG